MKKIVIILIGLFALASLGAAAIRNTQNKEEAAVRQVVETYLHGLKFNDVESFKKVFHPEAKLFFVKRDNQLGQLTQEKWYEGFKSSTGKEEEGDLRISNIDITDNAASVRVVEDYPKSVYTDYISLLKINNEWRIVNKIYTSNRK